MTNNLAGQNGQWSVAGPANPRAKEQFSSAFYNGKVYVLGGYVTDSTTNLGFGSASIEVYDLMTKRWDISKIKMPSPRAHSSIEVLNNKLYVIGGSSGWPLILRYDDIEVFDLLLDSWDPDPIRLSSRRYGSGSCIVEGQIYVIGGFDRTSQGISTVEAYDPVSKIWEKKADMPTARGSLSVCYLNGKIYALGGVTSSGDIIPYFEIYDIQTNSWQTGPAAHPKGLYGHATWVYNNFIYIAGGITGLDPELRVNTYNTKMTVYDPQSKAVFEVCSFPYRANTTAIHVKENEFLSMCAIMTPGQIDGTYSKGSVNIKYMATSNPVVAIHREISNTYLHQTDSLFFRTSFINHKERLFTAHINLKNSANNIEKSVQLHDDGLHNDYHTSDGVYGGWIGNLSHEDIYYIEVITTDINGDRIFTSSGIERPFTTIGPLKVDDSSSMELKIGESISPDTVSFSFGIRNNGKIRKAEGVEVELFCADPNIALLSKQLLIGDILPGETVNASSKGKLIISSGFRTKRPIEIYVSIQSNGNSFWHDILRFE
jgi:hypothetical protein